MPTTVSTLQFLFVHLWVKASSVVDDPVLHLPTLRVDPLHDHLRRLTLPLVLLVHGRHKAVHKKTRRTKTTKPGKHCSDRAREEIPPPAPTLTPPPATAAAKTPKNKNKNNKWNNNNGRVCVEEDGVAPAKTGEETKEFGAIKTRKQTVVQMTNALSDNSVRFGSHAKH